VGEITRFDSGFSRIFFQSHIYVLLLLCFLLPWYAFIERWKQLTAEPISRRVYLLTALTLLIVFLSYSRSFWIALCATLLVLAVWLVCKERISFGRIVACVAMLILTFAIDYGVAFGLVNIPLSGFGGVDAGALLTARTKNLGSEPAAASRWDLITPLAQAATKHPVIGSGFGTAVTYTSSDLRVRQDHPDGRYTTTAFEWGYLDLALKFGLLGLLVYGFFIYRVIRVGIKKLHTTPQAYGETLGLLTSVVALLCVHVFTPYLNHPLGIGWLLLTALLFATPTTKQSPHRL
jgi:O-antigen ligase